MAGSRVSLHAVNSWQGLALGWLVGVRQCRSPNFNQRPAGVSVDTLVIHNISLPPGQFGGGNVERFFLNQLPADEHPFYQEIAGVEVSAHFLIERCGRVTQFVSCDERAWHAGRSQFQGRDNVNDFSIGIELEGTDHAPYSVLQYRSLAALTAVLQQHYPQITASRITGHSDIAPGRKTDPGASFDWTRYRSLINQTG